MFLDASAIIGILTEEPEAESLSAKLVQGSPRLTSAVAVWESVVGLARKKQGMSVSEASEIVDGFLLRASVRLIPIGDEERAAAIRAFDRFGKGRHSAGLNMGDCFAYACATTSGEPLLFKGEDFARTDIAAA